MADILFQEIALLPQLLRIQNTQAALSDLLHQPLLLQFLQLAADGLRPEIDAGGDVRQTECNDVAADVLGPLQQEFRQPGLRCGDIQQGNPVVRIQKLFTEEMNDLKGGGRIRQRFFLHPPPG